MVGSITSEEGRDDYLQCPPEDISLDLTHRIMADKPAYMREDVDFIPTAWLGRDPNQPKPILNIVSGFSPYRLALTEALHLRDSDWHSIAVDTEDPGTWRNLHSKYIVLGDTKFTPLEVTIAPSLTSRNTEQLAVWLHCSHPPVFLPKGQIIAQAIPASGPPAHPEDLWKKSAKKSYQVCQAQVIEKERPKLSCYMRKDREYKHLSSLLDTGADVTVIPARNWPSLWELQNVAGKIQGLAQYKAQPKGLSSVPSKQNLLQVSPPEVVFQGFVAHEVSEMVVSLMNKDKLSSVPSKQNLLQVSPPEVVFQGFVAHEVSEMVVSLMNKDKLTVKAQGLSPLHFMLESLFITGTGTAGSTALLPLAKMLDPEGIWVHPQELRACGSTAESAFGKGVKEGFTRAQTGLLLSCFHEWQNNCFMSFLQLPEVVKVSMESSPYFQLAGSNDAYRVVTPGVPAPVRIRFTPGKGKDYSHELICTTARERIVVPIRAIGAQATLEFPDQLDFSECPVKHSSQKTLLVRNVSNRAVHYQLSTQSPFSVDPATGTVGAGDTVQVTVGFHALTTGDYSGSLCCNTGEGSTHTELHAEAVELNIGLSTNFVAVETTFITMSNHKTMFIENRSNVTAHFQWKAFPTEEGENREKRRPSATGRLSRQNFFFRVICLTLWSQDSYLFCQDTWVEMSQENLTEEETSESEMSSCEEHTALLSNTVLEEIAKVQQDPMLFSDDIFFIEPVEGEIGPNCSAEIKVTFKPIEALEYRSVAYCNISGCESRLPLRLRGHGKGPLVELNCRTLNLGNVSVNTPYVHEVQLINLGAIDAPFTYISSNANVGCYFKFAPKEGIIAPGGTQTIQVSFSATVLGTFKEEFQFSVAGSHRSALLTIK
ncbi:Hydrocephalus-inducing [Lonchura striata]|uniref:Hydrocephalus-inducing n=1 Tax=Lonchura striata TaxID=40157 RepID=A0A218U7H4_9PASE|nr:Hydrocephalus-inducing [Lonchura striata domestica]